MHILSTKHHSLACMTCKVKEVHFQTLNHAAGSVWRQPDVKAKKTKTEQETQPKIPKHFIFYFWKVLKSFFHFWRRRFIFGLLIAGDCNHSAACDRIGQLLLRGWRCKRMSRLKLKAAICHTRALRHWEGDSFMGMNLWTFQGSKKEINQEVQHMSEWDAERRVCLTVQTCWRWLNILRGWHLINSFFPHTIKQSCIYDFNFSRGTKCAPLTLRPHLSSLALPPSTAYTPTNPPTCRYAFACKGFSFQPRLDCTARR